MRDATGLDEGMCSRGAGGDPFQIYFKKRLVEFARRLDMGVERKRKVKNDSKIFGLNNTK
jgi:hypothetical protein